MARLHRYTLREYHDRFYLPQYVQNHIVFLEDFDSEVTAVEPCSLDQFYKIRFSDRSQSIIGHSAIVFVQIIPGRLTNY